MEIPITVIVYSGQEQHKATEMLFGHYSDPENPNISHPNRTHELDGGTIKLKNFVAREAMNVPQDINIILDIVKDIGVGLISAYIYDKLSSIQKAKVRIGKKEIDVIKDEIHKAIKEEFEKQKEEMKE